MLHSLGLFLFFSVCVHNGYCQEEGPCKQVNAKCISLKDCQYYENIFKDFSSQASEILKNANCGFEGKIPKVCCPPSVTSTSPATTFISKSGGDDFVPSFLGPPVCGLSNASFERVVGGVDANLDDFPWMALLGYNTRRGTEWLCGGSLISSRHVLTAGHCIHNREHQLYVVRLGELDLSREDEGAFPIDVLIKTMIAHEQYDANNYNNDIGLLILQKDIEFTHAIRPICIPKDEQWKTESFENYNPLIAGWGRTTYNGEPASHLQVLQLPVLNNDACVEAYKAYKTQVFDNRILCAGYLKEEKDACQGDSGGPLIQPLWSDVHKKSFFYTIGVVSYGRGCAQPEFPGIYTRVTHFLPWIKEKVLGDTTPQDQFIFQL